MPNWCQNTLTGFEDVRNAIFKDKGEGEGEQPSLSALLPPPAAAVPSEDCFSCKDGTKSLERDEYWKPSDAVLCNYHWQIANWGCKWDIGEAYVSEDFIQFETPWGPPSEWFVKLCAIYPDAPLMLEFEEPGMDIYGALRNVKGRVQEGTRSIEWFPLPPEN